jgi:phosphate transport system permease protein
VKIASGAWRFVQVSNKNEGIGVADMAVQSDVMEAAGPYDRAKALSAFKLGDLTFYWITRISAISVLLILGVIILSLIVGA